MADVPRTRQGGREPAPEEHDRPEQNEGYDRAVRGGGEYEDAWKHIQEDQAKERAERDTREAEEAAEEVRKGEDQ